MYMHILFTSGVKKDAPCWQDGYMNSGTLGAAHEMILQLDKKENITTHRYTLAGGKSVDVAETLDRDSFIERYSKVFKIDAAALSEVIQMTVFCDEAEENLSDEGVLIMRRGSDYSGEIPVSDLPKITQKLLKNIRVCFMQVEKKT